MSKKHQTNFERKHGFAAPPRPHFEGTWAPYFMKVEAKLTCKTCGGEINLTLKGDPWKCGKEQIGKRVLAVAERKHECAGVNAELEAHLDKYYGDLRRGMEKKHEADHKGVHGKSTAKA